MKQSKARPAHVSALLAAMATLGGSVAVYAQTAPNSAASFNETIGSLNALSIGSLPDGVNTVITNLQGYKTSEVNKKAGLVSAETDALNAVTAKASEITAKEGQITDKDTQIAAKDAQIAAKDAEITAKAAQITTLISGNPLDPQIAVEQSNLDALQGAKVALQGEKVTVQAEKVTLQVEKTNLEGQLSTLNANLSDASKKVLDSTLKIALYDQVLAPTTGTVDKAKAAAAEVAADVTKARNQFASGGSGDNANATGTQGLQSVIDTLNGVSAGDPTDVVNALNNADSNFQITGADNATISDIQTLVGEINAQLPKLPPISVADRDTAVAAVLNGAYERNAIDTIQSSGIAGIVHRDPVTGAVHIGENSLITNEVGGVQELYAQDAGANPININVTNGSDLLVNGVSVATDADVAAEATTRAAADTAETNARIAADDVLTTNLNNEVAARIADVNAEETARIAADNAEATTRAAADTVLTTNLSNEVARATAAEGVLTTNLSNEVAARIADVNAEEAARIAADNAEATTRAAADTVLTTNLSNEVTRATAAEGVLQGNINAEAATRASADTTLQANIDAEVAARIVDVNAEETRALAAEAALASRATALETRATSLESRSTALEGRMGRAESDIRSLRKGIAMSAALQTPVINDGDKQAVKVGAATYDGEQGLGFGYARRVNDSVTVNVDVATGFPETVARGGVNLSF